MDSTRRGALGLLAAPMAGHASLPASLAQAAPAPGGGSHIAATKASRGSRGEARAPGSTAVFSATDFGVVGDGIADDHAGDVAPASPDSHANADLSPPPRYFV